SQVRVDSVHAWKTKADRELHILLDGLLASVGGEALEVLLVQVGLRREKERQWTEPEAQLGSNRATDAALVLEVLVCRATPLHQRHATVQLERDRRGRRKQEEGQLAGSEEERGIGGLISAVQREAEIAGDVAASHLQAEPLRERDAHSPTDRDPHFLLEGLAVHGLDELGRGDVDAEGRRQGKLLGLGRRSGSQEGTEHDQSPGGSQEVAGHTQLLALAGARSGDLDLVEMAVWRLLSDKRFQPWFLLR